jgi:hypothetical protein
MLQFQIQNVHTIRTNLDRQGSYQTKKEEPNKNKCQGLTEEKLDETDATLEHSP